jgi:hypothetical protein
MAKTPRGLIQLNPALPLAQLKDLFDFITKNIEGSDINYEYLTHGTRGVHEKEDHISDVGASLIIHNDNHGSIMTFKCIDYPGEGQEPVQGEKVFYAIRLGGTEGDYGETSSQERETIDKIRDLTQKFLEE